MIGSIKDLLKPKVSLGCDIGATSVKFVCLKHEQDGLSLLSLGIIEADVLQNNNVAIQRVRGLMKERGLLGSSTGVNIEDPTLRIRRMDLPEMPENDLRTAIRWNFREYVEGSIEKYSIAHSTFGDLKVQSDKKAILAYAISNESVERTTQLTKNIGLKAVAIEPNASALLASYDLNYGWETGKFYAMIDLGGLVANFIVLGNGVLLFSRPLGGTGCLELLKLIAKDKAVSIEQAAALLKEDQAQESVSVFLSQIVVEIQRSVDAFCMMFHVDKVDSIILAGGGSLISGICEFLSKNLGIVTKLFDPFEKIDLSLVKEKIANPQLYAVAVGLAVPRS